MAKTVIGLIENSSEAQKAVEELLKSGFDRKDIGVISSDILREASAAVTGASKGMVIGGLAGMLLAATSLAIPGIGPVLVAGPALTLLAGTTVGAIAGGLIGGLKSRGVPEEDAHFFAEGVRRGGTLITVVARTDELAERAVEIMKRHGAMDMSQRAADWKKQGWSGRFQAKGETPKPAEAQSNPATAKATAPKAAEQPAQAESQVPTSKAPAAQPADRPVEAERTAPATEQDQPMDEPAIALSAVRVYSVVIEMPDDAVAANQPSYSGPERRARNDPYSGRDRRRAA
jgi:hypothetical protein